LAILLLVLPVALLIARRRDFRLNSRLVSLRGYALAALAIAFLFAPGRASAQLTDWENMCNGGQGVPPETVIMGCSQVLNTAGESATNAAIAYNNRGNAFRAEARFTEAMNDYNSAIIVTPQDPFPYRNRGVTEGLLGDYARALSDFDRAIALQPNYASAYLGRAFADAQLGDAASSAADFEKAVRLDPNLASAAGLPNAQAAQQARASVAALETALPQR
jgi:tetratricopeptide (TPR) repeat protein